MAATVCVGCLLVPRSLTDSPSLIHSFLGTNALVVVVLVVAVLSLKAGDELVEV